MPLINEITTLGQLIRELQKLELSPETPVCVYDSGEDFHGRIMHLDVRPGDAAAPRNNRGRYDNHIDPKRKFLVIV